MKKEILFDPENKTIEIIFTIKELPSAKELPTLLGIVNKTKERVLLHIKNSFKITVKINITEQDEPFTYIKNVVKITLMNLEKKAKMRLLAKKPALSIKERKLIFKIDEIFVPALKDAKQYIEETTKLLNVPITVSWYYATDIKIREKIEKARRITINEAFRSRKIHEYKRKLDHNTPPFNSYGNRNIISIKSLKDLADLPNGTRVTIKAKIVLIKKKNHYIFYVEDNTGGAKVITYRDEHKNKVRDFKKGDSVFVEGSLKHDAVTKENLIWFRDMYKENEKTNNLSNLIGGEEKDHQENEQPRFELHCHTKMSAYDGVSNIADYYERLKKLGHNGMAITDHDSVQAFPEASRIQKQDKNFKFLFGVELTTLENNIAKLPCYDLDLNQCEFIIFDIETTGLFAEYDSILEISMKKWEDSSGMGGFNPIKKELHFYIKQDKMPSENTLKFTNISKEKLLNGISLEKGIAQILDFINSFRNPVLIAHNAFFDYTFLKKAFKKAGKILPKVTIIDTLSISRLVLNNKKSYALGTVARAFKIPYNAKLAHGASYDVDVLGKVWSKLKTEIMETLGLSTTKHIMEQVSNLIDNWERRHTTLLCRNDQGKRDLYKLLTLASTKYLKTFPRLPFNEIEKNRKNLLVGSSCWNGYVFQNALENDIKALDYWLEKMDYVEIQPLEVYYHLLGDSLLKKKDLEQIVCLIVRRAKKKNKIVVATSDAHYANDNDKVIRDIYINTKGLKGSRHEFYRTLATKLDPTILIEGPNQVYRTTSDMLSRFGFLKDIIDLEDLVINNSYKIANLCENINIHPQSLHPPKIRDIDTKEWLVSTTQKNAEELYKNKIPPFVKKRINKEIEILTRQDYSSVYYISSKLVKECAKNNNLVGSRGSVGSSLVAFLLKITEVNPLNPHYFCEKCGNYELYEDAFSSAFDMDKKKCNKCGNNEYMKRYGMGIPFETFLGFEGDKIPDIDLNLPIEQQLWSHDYVKEMMGAKKTFRAGTILTVADKNAYAIFMEYNDALPEGKKLQQKDVIIGKISGVKKTTSQHPGGIILPPHDEDINYFTPLQYPSNNKNKQQTTHFDFDFLHDNLFKLDLLAHGNPSMIGHLMRITGKHVNEIDYNDSTLVKLFSDCSIMGISSKDIAGEITGSIALPEFGTKNTRQITKVIKPKTFADLVRISGISHGDGVWKGNIEKLVKEGVPLQKLITCRDDIMIYLNNHMIPSEISFMIMEKVRKGIRLLDEEINILVKHKVPQQYIEMCNKINYLFPKAHAVAYVIMAYRCAYYKLHHKIAFYCAHFTWKAKKFPYLQSQYNLDRLIAEYKEMSKLDRKSKNLDEKILNDLEIVMEMKARGIRIFLPDLNKASANEYLEFHEENAMMIPISALDGFGKMAETIISEREKGLFKSFENFKERVNINVTQEKLLRRLNLCLV